MSISQKPGQVDLRAKPGEVPVDAAGKPGRVIRPIFDEGKLKTKIDAHLNWFNQHEKEGFDKARRYHRGDFQVPVNVAQGDDAKAYMATKNLVFQITESALNNLVPTNPLVAATAGNPLSEDGVPSAEALLAWVWRANKMRREITTSLMDAIHVGRSAFKTGWDTGEDRPIIEAVDPYLLHFDLRTRNPDKIRYWMQCTPLDEETFLDRIESGRYKLRNGKTPQDYLGPHPTWMLDDSKASTTTSATAGSRGPDDAQVFGQWAEIWEYYDRNRGVVMHVDRKTGHVLFRSALTYVPYDLYYLNPNAVDCRGVSEVQLILDKQDKINTILSFLLQITFLQVPRILYDEGLIGETDLNQLVSAAGGAFVGMKLSQSAQGAMRAISDAFFAAPVPEAPQGLIGMLERLESDAQADSALADTARVQRANFRTATEAASANESARGRTVTREGHLNDAMVGCAQKAYWLCQRYMSKPKWVRVAGAKWSEVSFTTIKDVEVEFTMMPHSPLAVSPAIRNEMIAQAYPMLLQMPNVDILQINEEILTGLGFSRRGILSRTETTARMAAAAEAERLRSMGGAAADAGAGSGAPGEQGGQGGQGQPNDVMTDPATSPEQLPGPGTGSMEEVLAAALAGEQSPG